MNTAHVVLLKDGAPKDWMRAAQIADRASPTLGRADATRVCRFGHGLILIPLTQAEAEKVAGELSAGGFAAEALALSEVVVAPKAFSILRADLNAEGLSIQADASGQASLLPWPVLRILHLAFVKPTGGRVILPDAKIDESRAEALATAMLDEQSQTSTLETLGEIGLLAASMGLAAVGGPRLLTTLAAHRTLEEIASPGTVPVGSAPPAAPSKDPEVWLELLALEPLLRLRIRRHAFRYDYLGERRLATGRANFRLLVKDVAEGAAQAARTGLIEAVLKGAEPDQTRQVREEKDHELALTALLTREKRYGLPRAADSNPG
ncbi:MAG: hypothetical protein KIS92_03755 [Planctomycetota bacterium]|nr:hypothetical protein [Planctomycetota bacterium]